MNSSTWKEPNYDQTEEITRGQAKLNLCHTSPIDSGPKEGGVSNAKFSEMRDLSISSTSTFSVLVLQEAAIPIVKCD